MLGADDDLVVDMGAEGSDEVWGQLVELLGMGDVSKKVGIHIFFLWTPNFCSSFMEDSVEVGVLLSSCNTRQRSEEMGEEVEVDIVGSLVAGGGCTVAAATRDG